VWPLYYDDNTNNRYKKKEKKCDKSLLFFVEGELEVQGKLQQSMH
jgi:hypothetical protein